MFLDVVAHRLELENHGDRSARVVCVDNEERRLKVRARYLADPPDDSHAAVFAVVVDEVLAAQVVVEMDLAPGFAKRSDAVGSRLDPDCFRVFSQELGCTRRVVVKEENAPTHGQICPESKFIWPGTKALCPAGRILCMQMANQ
jgi:hypothetical protein